MTKNAQLKISGLRVLEHKHLKLCLRVKKVVEVQADLGFKLIKSIS